jgi:hypothetical protein
MSGDRIKQTLHYLGYTILARVWFGDMPSFPS